MRVCVCVCVCVCERDRERERDHKQDRRKRERETEPSSKLTTLSAVMGESKEGLELRLSRALIDTGFLSFLTGQKNRAGTKCLVTVPCDTEMFLKSLWKRSRS